MAVHKVPQDVEAEDKFLGPLTFKQFLFAGGMVICGYLTFLTITRVWPISFIFLVPTLLFAVLAFPWSREQPTELFLGSRLRFFIKPRRRVWDQSGMKELVNVTAPVREAHVYSDGLSQGEVKSRLSALATMVDSRGWAVKNISGQLVIDPASDRLVTVAPSTPSENTIITEQTPDMLDDSAGEAKQFDTMIEASESKHKSETLSLIEKARQKTKNYDDKIAGQSKDEKYWFSEKQSANVEQQLTSFAQPQTVQATQSQPAASPTKKQTTTTLSEEELLEKAHEKKRRDNLQLGATHQVKTTAQKASEEKAEKKRRAQEKDAMTHPVNPDILELSQSNDLSVQTIAHQANKKDSSDDGEVVISLH